MVFVSLLARNGVFSIKIEEDRERDREREREREGKEKKERKKRKKEREYVDCVNHGQRTSLPGCRSPKLKSKHTGLVNKENLGLMRTLAAH